MLLSGETPFGGACEDDDKGEVMSKILSGNVSFESEYWDHVSESAVDFIKSLLKLDPEERPSASELKKHPWLKSMKRNGANGVDELSLSSHVKDYLQAGNSSTNRNMVHIEVSHSIFLITFASSIRPTSQFISCKRIMFCVSRHHLDSQSKPYMMASTTAKN